MMEEAAEVQKLCSKIIRFGEHDFHPNTPSDPNGQKLFRELSDFEAMRMLAIRTMTSWNSKTADIDSVNKLKNLKVWSEIDHGLIDEIVGLYPKDEKSV